jgi:hypothetical protein
MMVGEGTEVCVGCGVGGSKVAVGSVLSNANEVGVLI